MARLSTAERLERNSIPEPNSGCLLWLGTVSKTSGHGRIKIAGKWHSPHRVAFVEKNGPIPDGLDVCHKCDVPTCINEAHLWAGTHRENMTDMWKKGRGKYPSFVWRPRFSSLVCRVASCHRCGKAIQERQRWAKYCSPKCRWNTTRTQEQRDRYNAARNERARAARAARAAMHGGAKP